MKYSFFSSACAWFPSALMMAVSASGASSAPLASLVKYVPVHTVPHRSHRHIRYNSGHVEAFCTLQVRGREERGEGSRTFVPGQISAQDDDEAQGDEDHHGHHSTDERVVGAGLHQSVGIWRRRWRARHEKMLWICALNTSGTVAIISQLWVGVLI